MQAKRLFVCVALTLTVLMASAASPEKRTLTLEDCLQLALRHNLDIQMQRISPEIARFNLKSSYGAYDPNLNLRVQRDGADAPGGYDPQSRLYGSTSTDADSISGGLSGLMPWGLQYNLGLNLSDRYGYRQALQATVITNFDGTVTTNIFYVPDVFENSSGNVGLATLRQPLMRDAWIDGARYSIELNRTSLRASEHTLRQQIMFTATQVESAYYNLSAAADSVTVQEKALELAERLLAENRKKVEVGALAPLDEKQAEAEVAARRADLLSAQRALEDQQNALKTLLTDDYAAWHPIRIEPAAKLTAVPIGAQVSDSWLKGLTQRPDLIEARINLERQDIAIKYQKNQLWPQLDVYGSFGYSAGGDAREFGDLWPQFEDRDNPSYSIGAQFSIPLGNRAARNNLRATRATKAQLLLSLKKLEQTIMVEIDNAVGAVKTAYQQVQATRERRRFAQAAYEAEQKKLENGKSTSFFVLQFQRDLVSAAAAEIQALTRYNNAVAQLSLSEGSTLDRLKLDVSIR